MQFLEDFIPNLQDKQIVKILKIFPIKIPNI